MVLASLYPLRDALADIVVVTQPSDTPIHHLLLTEGIPFTVCHNAHQGMGASLAWGVKTTLNYESYVVALADMPFIHSCSVKKIVRALMNGASIAAPTFLGQRGHPVGFSCRMASQLLSLNDDYGAREIIHRYRHLLRSVPVSDGGVVRDVDVPEDLR